MSRISTNIEFRWDAFNLFNHPGFGFPNQNFDSPTAGRITSTVVDNRSDAVLAEAQLLATEDTDDTARSHFITGANERSE